MAYEHLAIYLNDHLSGSVTVLELLPHLEKAYAGTELERFFKQLDADISADRQELEALMVRLHIGESGFRKASAWMAEKISEMKLKLDDPGGGYLRLLEALELIAVGIDGKRALWDALAAAAEGTPALQGTDYGHLAQRAAEQRQRVEPVRLETAKVALSAGD
ncbi:MAG: hypothetical protein JWN14_2014 [Chthonomonadales bacterium]|nr:hypothetical protein [Chthonomonadales bacterium]